MDAVDDVLRQLVLEVIELGLCLVSCVLDVHLGDLEFLPFCVFLFEFLCVFDHAIDLGVTDSSGILDHH